MFMRNLIARFVREEDGMEMLEWAIVAVVFAVAAIGAWQAVQTLIDGRLRGIRF
jgi:Flp pilus assembly pilin Flp